MNDFEERLQNLLNEQVDARVEARPIPEFFVDPARPDERRPRPAWLLPLLAAACVLILGGSVLTAAHLFGTPDKRQETVGSVPAPTDSASTTIAAVSPTPPRSAARSTSPPPRARPAASTTPHRVRASSHRVPNPPARVRTSALPPTRTPTTAAASAPTPPPAVCDAANLVITDPRAEAGPAGMTAYVVFQNAGDTACTLQGRPLVVPLDASGAAGTAGNPAVDVPDPAPPVLLAPAGLAAARIGWTPPDPSAATGSCPEYSQLRVTTPGTATDTVAPVAEVMQVCNGADDSTSLTVEPIAAGYPW